MARILPKISSTQNPWVKHARRLHNRDDRFTQRRFLLEGPILVEEAISNGWPLETICYGTVWKRENERLITELTHCAEDSGPQLQPVSTEVLEKLSTTKGSCTVIAIAKMASKTNDFSNTETAPRNHAFVALESIQDPGNLGTLIRIAAAVGRTTIITSYDSVDTMNPKVLRASTGQWFRNPPRTEPIYDFVAAKKSEGYTIFAASAEGLPMWNRDLSRPTVLLLGNEGAGISHKLRSLASDTIAIPMSAGVESLNVAIAGGLILYERKRQLEHQK
jgi:RNA methyltransferase, TrmH family